MIDPQRFVFGPDVSLDVTGIDLEREEFILPDGRRLTEELAREIADDALAARRRANLVPGRKSLSGDGSHSPVVQFRSPRKAEAQAIADELGISLSELARRAFDGYLNDRGAKSA